MATYVGFTTQTANPNQIVQTSGIVIQQAKQGNKFRLTDEQLVIRDLLNAFSIRQGEKPGMPSYGTSIWSYLYEPNDPQTHNSIETEIRRVIAEDSRIELNTVAIWPQENGILFEVEVMIRQFNEPMTLQVELDATNGRVSLV
jgi:phage baseplate assembly protein W